MVLKRKPKVPQTRSHRLSAVIPTPTGKAGKTTAAKQGIVSDARHGKG